MSGISLNQYLLGLASGEIFAAMDYAAAAHKRKRNELNLSKEITDHLIEHLGEEREHFHMLREALIKRGNWENPGMALAKKIAIPPLDDFNRVHNEREAVEYFIKAEDEAMDAYSILIYRIQEGYYEDGEDLIGMLTSIRDDEIEHKEDFEEILEGIDKKS